MNYDVLITRHKFQFNLETSFWKTMKMIFLLFLIFDTTLIGQTDSIEKAVLNNKLKSKEIDNADYVNIGKLWNQKINKEKYPDQPIDQDGKVHYTYVNDFKGFDKEYLFNRTLEWLSIYYGLLPSSLYSNLKDGKIIYNLTLNLITNYSCIPTTIISIKDEKIRLELFNISYQAYYAGDYENGIPEKTVNIEVYPIILKKTKDWDLNLTLLRETTKLFDSEVQKLNTYISRYEDFK